MTINVPKKAKAANTEDRAAGFISGGSVVKADAAAQTAEPTAASPKAKKAVVNMRFDPPLLAKVDAAAKRKGITRTAWIHWVVGEALNQ
jgi:predicted DNA binding CopG/RHH family protein